MARTLKVGDRVRISKIDGFIFLGNERIRFTKGTIISIRSDSMCSIRLDERKFKTHYSMTPVHPSCLKRLIKKKKTKTPEGRALHTADTLAKAWDNTFFTGPDSDSRIAHLTLARAHESPFFKELIEKLGIK